MTMIANFIKNISSVSPQSKMVTAGNAKALQSYLIRFFWGLINREVAPKMSTF